MFLAAASALVVAAALGVLAGGAIAHIVPPRTLRILGGIGFILVGAWMLAGTRA